MVSEHVTELSELSIEGVLDAVEAWHATRTEADAAIFVAAAHFADLHHPDSRRAETGPVLPGSERGVRLGGAGTPMVLEFAPAEFAARIGKSPYAGRALVADALDTRHRLPRLWARVCAGEVPVFFARHVALKTRERLAAEEEFVKVGRCNEHGQKTMYVKSTSALIILVFATIDYLAEVLAALGDTDSVDKRRAKALLIMANPLQAVQLVQTFTTMRAGSSDGDGDNDGDGDGDGADTLDDPRETAAEDRGDVTGPQRFRPHQIGPDSRFSYGFDPHKLLPAVTLHLHLYARTDTGEVGPVARWEGEGPVSTAYVRDLLGPACEFTIKPVIDLAGMAPVDAYEIPDRHREAVHLRSPADVFPYAANTTRRMQIDHTKAYLSPDHGGPPGQTSMSNLGPMTGFHHRIKTHGRWQVKQPFPGIFLWRDPHGRCYLVDHTGTRPVGKTGSGDGMPDIPIDIVPGTPGAELE